MKTNDQFIDPKTQKKVTKLFSLNADKADDETIDSTIRDGVGMKGTNLWVLMFAIIVASIGLNVNSTAVIIGAMLISPLMGPIMGIGYGIGIYDFALIQRSLKNLCIAVFISILVSALYFLISPLNQAQSELLSRTTPTIWDVAIALFGGLAGIVGVTRKEKSNNIIPGVAIATALMPPLCTAGFELVNHNWLLMGGALYLFTINSVFIALASALIVRIFHVKKKQFINQKIAWRVKHIMSLIAIVTLVPSIYLAYNLVQKELFKSNANKFVEQEITSAKTHVTQTRFNPTTKLIEVAAIGEFISSARLAEITKRLPYFGLPEAKLVVYQQNNKQQQIDVGSLKSGLLSDLYTKSQQSLEKKEQRIQELEKSLDIQNEYLEKIKSIPNELHAVFPQIYDVLISNAISWNQNSGIKNDQVLVVNIKTTTLLSDDDQTRIKHWLNTRMKSKQIKLIIDSDYSKTIPTTEVTENPLLGKEKNIQKHDL